jgi:hypothetical protein
VTTWFDVRQVRRAGEKHATINPMACPDLADQDDLASGLISDILQKPFSMRQLRDVVERHNPRKSHAPLV